MEDLVSGWPGENHLENTMFCRQESERLNSVNPDRSLLIGPRLSSSVRHFMEIKMSFHGHEAEAEVFFCFVFYQRKCVEFTRSFDLELK